MGDDSHAFADKAEQIFQSQLVARPDDPELLASLAEAKCLTGRLQEAVTYVTDLANRFGDKWQIWVAQSFVYRYAGTYYLLSKMKFARVSVSDEYSEQLSSAATKFPNAEEVAFAENLLKQVRNAATSRSISRPTTQSVREPGDFQMRARSGALPGAPATRERRCLTL